MNIIQKSESIRAALRKGFQDGTSKLAQHKCYGYGTDPNGELIINPDEASTIRWIFDRYLNGDSLGKIVAGLEEQGIPSPTGRPKWNREAINKLISNEKYTGRVLLQKTISAGGAQIKNDGFMERYLYSDSHEAIISDEIFRDAQQKKLQRTNQPEKNLPFNYSSDPAKLSNACCDTHGTGTFISAFKSHFSTRIMFHSFYNIFLKWVW